MSCFMSRVPDVPPGGGGGLILGTFSRGVWGYRHPQAGTDQRGWGGVIVRDGIAAAHQGLTGGDVHGDRKHGGGIAVSKGACVEGNTCGTYRQEKKDRELMLLPGIKRSARDVP